MCVTLRPAAIDSTQTYVYVPPTPEGADPKHICAYQNTARSSMVNCMFLNFAGSNLQPVQGPEHTVGVMNRVVAYLPELRPTPSDLLGGSRSRKGATVVDYGDYTLVYANSPGEIIAAIGTVRADRRPVSVPALADMAAFYGDFRPHDSFVLACFSGNVRPKHPIVVSYTPHNPDILTAPGLDGHNGRVPVPGTKMARDFTVAFGVYGTRLPFNVQHDASTNTEWLPESVTGFVDNRREGLNQDYVVPIDVVKEGLAGPYLADQLLAA